MIEYESDDMNKRAREKSRRERSKWERANMEGRKDERNRL